MGGNRPTDSATGTRSKDDDTPELNALQIVAATGASTTAAVVANLLGVYGTVIGVAVISMVSSIATVLYLRSINGTRKRLRKARRTATDDDRTGSVSGPIRPAAPDVDATVVLPTVPAQAPVPIPDTANRGGLRAWWRRNGRVMAVSSLIVFVCSIAVLTGIALLSGQAPATFYQQPNGPGQEQQPIEPDEPAPPDNPTTDSSPGDDDTSPTPSDSPSPEPTPTDPQPSSQSPSPSDDTGDDDNTDPAGPPSDDVSDPAQ